MNIVATQPVTGDTAALATSAILAAGDPLPHFSGSDLDRAAAAFDLAACIRSAKALLTEQECADFAAYLTGGAA
ncbi:MAG TPA: hypothetical protein VGH72_33510 [Pseudonocardia sp.]|jgi:hypothetical protein